MTISGSTFSGVLVPRSGGWAIDSGQHGVHDLDGYFDPFACRKIRVRIEVVPEPFGEEGEAARTAVAAFRAREAWKPGP